MVAIFFSYIWNNDKGATIDKLLADFSTLTDPAWADQYSWTASSTLLFCSTDLLFIYTSLMSSRKWIWWFNWVGCLSAHSQDSHNVHMEPRLLILSWSLCNSLMLVWLWCGSTVLLQFGSVEQPQTTDQPLLIIRIPCHVVLQEQLQGSKCAGKSWPFCSSL